jgi:gas vesicle protein
MNNKSEDNERSIFRPILLSLLTGVAIGTIIGMIYSPKAGKEIREDIKNKSEEFVEKSKKGCGTVADKTKETLDKSKEKFSEVKEKSEEIIEKGKEVISQAKNVVVEKLSKGKEKAKEVDDYLSN